MEAVLQNEDRCCYFRLVALPHSVLGWFSSAVRQQEAEWVKAARRSGAEEILTTLHPGAGTSKDALIPSTII